MVSMADDESARHPRSPVRTGVRSDRQMRCVAGLLPVWLSERRINQGAIDGLYPSRCLLAVGHSGPHESYMYEWLGEGRLPHPEGAQTAHRPNFSFRVFPGFIRTGVRTGSPYALWDPATVAVSFGGRVAPPPRDPDIDPKTRPRHSACRWCLDLDHHVCYACLKCRDSRPGPGP